MRVTRAARRQVKKNSRRPRQAKREEKPLALVLSEPQAEELPCTEETIYGFRYTRQVISLSLAKAPVLE